MVVSVDARIVTVAPVDADGVVADGLDAEHLEGGLVHLERIIGLGWTGGRPVRAGAGGAGTFIAKVLQAVFAVVAVFPVDGDAFRLGDGNVFGVDHVQLKRRSTSRTPEMRRMAETSFS